MKERGRDEELEGLFPFKKVEPGNFKRRIERVVCDVNCEREGFKG